MRGSHMRVPERLAEGSDTHYDSLLGWANSSREELQRRAAEIRSQFVESVDAEAAASATGWALVGTGVALGLVRAFFSAGSRRRTRDVVFPLVFIALGGAMLAGAALWRHRAMHISEAEMRVREEMTALDPVARIRILKDLASETVGAVPLVNRLPMFRR